MERQKIFMNHEFGIVEGIFINAGNDSPLVIIVNGHNGFYNYGMFPYIQEKFFQNGISSYSFNFSHSGVKGDSDHFEELDKYEQNCMRLETEDLVSVLRHVQDGGFGIHSKLFLMAHSLGGIPAIFGAKKATGEKIKIDGMILVSTVSKLNFWPAEMIREWKEKKVLYRKNNRTNQYLPQGYELLQEVLQSDTTWNVRETLQQLNIPALIIHGEQDESVPAEHAHILYSFAKEHAELKIIPGATHTYNTKHPFENSTPQLEELIKVCEEWIRDN